MTTSSDHETHEDEEYIKIVTPLLQPLFVKLLRNLIVSGPNPRVHALGYSGRFIMGWTGVRAGGVYRRGVRWLRWIAFFRGGTTGFIGGVSSRSPSKSRPLLPGGKWGRVAGPGDIVRISWDEVSESGDSVPTIWTVDARKGCRLVTRFRGRLPPTEPPVGRGGT